MRILFCNYEYPPIGGGGGVVNAALAEELAKRHEVTVLTSRAFDLPAESMENGVRVVRVPVFFRRRRASANFPSMFAYLVTGPWGGWSLLRRFDFDVVNTHFALPTGPVGHVLARMAGIPNVLSVHGGDLYDPSKRSSPHRHSFLRLCVKRLAMAADAVVAQSADTLSNLHRYFAPDANATVIPLGIPRPPVASASRSDYGFEDTDLLLVTVGRLVRRKAVDQLIDMVAELRDDRVKLVVIGSGPLSDELKSQAARRNVAEQVRFMGFVEESAKRELLSISDIFVSTSQHEGFGLVYLEAMAAGLPVVCYDRGGQTDFLEDGKSGHVVSLNDTKGFTERCRDLVSRRELCAAAGEHNKRRVEGFYIDRCAEQYEALFATLLPEAGHRAAGNSLSTDAR